jgi:hypothetical protein
VISEELIPPPIPVRTCHPLKARGFEGHRMVDLALPGDEHIIIEYKTRHAIERDSTLNEDELDVYLCMNTRLIYHSPVCLRNRCSYCGGFRAGDGVYFRELDIG